MNIEDIVGESFCGRKVVSVIGHTKPRNCFDPNRAYCVAIDDNGEFIHLEYAEENRGCGNYKWIPAYPFVIDGDNVVSLLESDSYGGTDNGYGDILWVHKEMIEDRLGEHTGDVDEEVVNNMFNGVEVCPYCECENEYNVESGVWITMCSHCGMPIVLCDKCYAMNGNYGKCNDCVHEHRCNVLRSVFESVNKEVK